MTAWMPREPILIATVAFLGLCLGSFLNVVIYRVPRGMSVVRPRSRCGSCGRPVRPWDNVPVLGWFWLRGRCRDCRASISFRYPAIELLGGCFALIAVFAFPRPVESLVAFWMLFSLLAVFFIDLESRIIPDEISLGGTLLGLALSHWTVGFVEALAAAATGAATLFLLGWFYQKTRGRAGMGMGDVKLAAMLGALLGFPGLLLTVILASFLGSAVGLAMMALRRADGATALPFGSFLAPAAMVVLLWGPRLWEWYLGFFPHAGGV
ncbi:MAG: prepilin peptidase [Candidatus Eisenbacteria bacterium]|uniref:Prepilin leader peptidase/N-methyltransferase n=1 Tax=Eiseniibacteriota bacterium TaxID=2212470 RepID=A0A956RNH3_UNCEI|nr:prepilin peptidase [Candidatus Eisenbacteria bacterium]